MARPTLDASGIGEYIHFECCPRYFKLRFEGEKERKDRAWAEAFKPITPLLYGAGDMLEDRKWKELKEQALESYDLSNLNYDEIGWNEAWRVSRGVLRKAVRKASVEEKVSQPILIYQLPLYGQIGLWNVKGKSDLIAIWPREDGGIWVRVFEVKASWEERTYHRIQVAIYAVLLRRALENLNLRCKIEGGVIYKETEIAGVTPEDMPSFEIRPLIEDVRRLMSTEGELNQIHKTDLPEVEYRLSWKCESCIYNESCFTRSIESEDISLLNLSRGEQRALRRHGIKTLRDLAGLKVVLRNEDQRPWNYGEIRPRAPEKVRELENDLVIAPKLDSIVQRAQFMLGVIRPDHRSANDRPWNWITGTGDGRLPVDEPPPGWDIDLGFEPGSLIRVYLHVQWDYMRNRVVMVSARVSCSNYEGEPISISKIANSLPDAPRQSLEEERRLLEGFFKQLFRAIRRVARGIGSPDKAPMHIYFYTRLERDWFMDAVRRQPTVLSAKAVRDLLGLRQAIDQPMVSIVQEEVVERVGCRYPSPGLLPVLEQSYVAGIGWFGRDDWVVTREDGLTVNLRKVFYHNFFNYSSPYRVEGDGSITLMLKKGAFRFPQKKGWYPLRARFGSQIPLEYIWAAKGRLEPSQARSNIMRSVIERCMWHDHRTKDKRITDEDITSLGKKLCHALEHIERSIIYKNPRLGKNPIEVPGIEEFTLGESRLDRACREYLDLEYFSRRHELYQHYALLPRQRVETGRAVVFQCTHIEENGEELEIEGRLLYEELGISDVEQVVNACRVKGSDGLSSGDWMVATEVERGGQGQLIEVGRRTPGRIERSARAIIEHIDLVGRTIKLKALGWWSAGNYCTTHAMPTTDPFEAQEKGYRQLFETGRMYILDEYADDIVAERASKALEHAEHNPLCRALEGFLAGGKSNSLRPLSLLREPAGEFVRWLRDEYSITPNSEQLGFIESIWKPFPISVLQGPPGTGKTENLHWAVLVHVFAHRQAGGRCHVLMVGPTHKAIHEFVSKLARCWRQYQEDGGHQLDSLRIIRVISKDSALLTEVEGVIYVNYHEDDEEVNELANWLRGQSTLFDFGDRVIQPLIICATPAGMYGLMKKVGGGDPPWGSSFFDLLAVDEASMMRLPDLILSGAFVSEDARVLIAGDHRQLPPIQVHDWEKEDRRTIEEIAPFLSAQDFLRLLRGEELGLEYLGYTPEAEIPMARLEETYRCHPTITKFLRTWVYSKDGINFRSEQTHIIGQVSAPTEGLKKVLDPQAALVLILHNERESYQSNPVEARIAKSLARQVQNETVGVITPHNAQRGLLRSELGEYVDRVDTVEKFQGGERDFIIISATVSDPDYVRAESDFLLNLNRLNVAMSRMKKKLVVIASRSIFEHMPKDAKDYDKAILWRGLLHEVGATSGQDPAWEGTLSEFLGEQASDVKIQVYTA